MSTCHIVTVFQHLGLNLLNPVLEYSLFLPKGGRERRKEQATEVARMGARVGVKYSSSSTRSGEVHQVLIHQVHVLSDLKGINAKKVILLQPATQQ